MLELAVKGIELALPVLLLGALVDAVLIEVYPYYDSWNFWGVLNLRVLFLLGLAGLLEVLVR